MANLFMIFAPLEGWRRVKVTDRHAAADYAQVLEELYLSGITPDAEQNRAGPRQSEHGTRPPRSYAAFPRARSAPPRQTVRMALTPRNTEAGSTWPNPNSASCRSNLSAAAFRTSRP